MKEPRVAVEGELPEYLKNPLLEAMSSLRDVPQAQGELRCIKGPVGCGEKISIAEWEGYDAETKREYGLSSLCGTCQRRVFSPPEGDECTCDTPCCEADVGVGVVTCGSQHCPVHRSST